jgi:hypothetical protein
MTASDRKPATANLPARPQTWTANRSPEETENMEVMDEIADEIRSVQEVEGVELYPAELDSETANVDPLAPLPPTADPDDEVSWEDPRPEPRSRNDALRAFHAALRELIDDPALRDPREPDGNTVLITPGEIHDRYPYRSRPWFSGDPDRDGRGRAHPAAHHVASPRRGLPAPRGQVPPTPPPR